MTSIGIQCNIEHANCDSSSNSQSVTVQAKNELLHDNDDRDQEKSYLGHDLHRSEADGMSLSQFFPESGETSSDRAKQTQDTSQEVTINSEHLNPTFAPKHNGEENAKRKIVFKNDSKNDTRTEKPKPCAVVAPFLRETETYDKEETVLKTSSIGAGEDMDIASNPDIQNAIVCQPDWCLFEASHKESEQIKDNAEDINLAQNSTEPFLLNMSYSLPSIESTQVSGDESYLDGAFTESNCSVLKSDDITKTHVVPQGRELSENESTKEDKIARDFGYEQSYKSYQNGKSCQIQSQTSNNVWNAKDSKGQNVLSSRTHLTKRHLRKNRNAQIKQRISRRHRVRMGRPLCKVRFDAMILKQHCKGHKRKIKIKGKYGLGNNIPAKDDSTVKFKILGKSGVKDTKKCKSLSNKEGLNGTYLPRAGDQLMETNINDIKSKPEISLKERQMSCKLKETPLKKSGNKRDIQSKNSLTKNQKGSKENKSADVRVKCKDNIQPISSQTKKVIRVIDNLIVQVKKNCYVFFYFGYKFGTQTTINCHTFYSSILKFVILDLGCIPLVQFTVAPASELIYCVEFENESRRRQTFRTYDNQDIVESLVRNGFFYSEGENQIVCYRCGGRHGRLRDGDIPERAHHSGCQFHSEADPGNHNEIRERERNRSMSDNVRLQGSSNSTQTSPSCDMVPGRVLHNVPQVLIDYFRRQNDPDGGRGGRPITVIPPFPFDEDNEHRRDITVLPPRPHINGGRRRRGITALPPRPPSRESISPSDGTINRTQTHEPRMHIAVLPPRPHLNGGRRRRGITALPPRPPSRESISPSDGTINRTQRTEAISTPSMPIPLPHRCVFCRIRPVSIRFEPCQHVLACYQCSLSKFICTECGKIIMKKSCM